MAEARPLFPAGRLLALLLAIPGLFTAAPGLVVATPALLLGAFGLFAAAPVQAQNPISSSATANSITVTWTRPTSGNLATNGQGYEVALRTPSASAWPDAVYKAGLGTTSHTFTGLTSLYRHRVRVRVRMLVGGQTQYGQWQWGEAFLNPPAPRNLRIIPSSTQLSLSWNKPLGVVSDYDVHYTSAAASSVPNNAAVQTGNTATAATGWLAVTRSGTATSQTISSLTNDTAYRVRVRARNISGAGAWLFGTGTPIEGTITLSGAAMHDEGSTITLTLTASHAIADTNTERRSGRYTVSLGTAEPGDLDRVVNFYVMPIGGTSQEVLFLSRQDTDQEDETFTVTLSDPPPGYTNASPSSLTITVIDDDKPSLSLSASPNPVREGEPVTVTANLSHATVKALTIPVTLTAGTAESGDYGSLTSISIAAGATSGTGTLTTVKDADSDEETLTVAQGTTLPATVTRGSPDSVEITINEKIEVTLGPASVTVDEGKKAALDLFASPCIDGAWEDFPVTTTRVTSERGVGQGVGQQDHDFGLGNPAQNHIFTLQSTSSSNCRANSVFIDTYEDYDYDHEIFTVELNPAHPNWPDGYVVGRQSKVTVTIRDAVPVAISAYPNPVKEGSPVRVRVWLPGVAAPDGGLVVPVKVTRDTSEENDHGNLASITIPAGANVSETMQLPTYKDNDGEHETFTVSLDTEHADWPDGYIARSDMSSAQVTVADENASSPPPITTTRTPTRNPTTGGGGNTGGSGDGSGPSTAGSSSSGGAPRDLRPSFGNVSVPDQSYTEGTAITPLVLPEATGGNGPLTYTLTPSPPNGLTLNDVTHRLSGNLISPQAATIYTWTATDADGDEATLTFTIAIAVDPHRQRVREAARRALAEMARRAMSGALDTIGARFGAIGGSGLSLAGQPVSLESVASVADGVGMAVWNNQSLVLGELLGESAFSLRLAASGEAGDGVNSEGPLWSVWGRGDLASFAGGREEETHYDGWLRSGWLGLDARSGRWVAGMALSHEQGQADYGATVAAAADDRPLQGRLETSLTALYPYGRWTLANGLELQGVVGVGWGEAHHTPADEQRETGPLSMRMASLGVRKSLPDVAGLALALRADAAVTRIETGDGPEVIHNLSADSWRLRTGLEASRRFSLEGEAFLEPFLEAAARQDGGDGLEGSGVELAGGLRYSAPNVAVELRGRWLAAHSEEGAEEQGVSLTARYGPGADGQGLFFALSPRWGAATGGAQVLWGEDLPVLSTADAGNSGAVDAQVGYGFALPQGGVLTPFAEVGLAGADSRRLRLGTRYAATVTGLEMAVEMAGERRESGDAAAEHALQLDVDFHF